MKRLLSLLVLAALAILPLGACQTPAGPSADVTIVGGEFDYMTSDLSSYISLPESVFADIYATITNTPAITDADVLAEFNGYFSNGSYYAPKAGDDTVDTGDLLYFDFHGVLLSDLEQAVNDGKIPDVDCTGMSYTEILAKGLGFSNGSSTSLYSLEVGSGRFVAGFESGLVGHTVSAQGEDNPLRVRLTFPDSYSIAEMAGKDVIFFCRLAYIGDKNAGLLTSETVSVEILNKVLGLTGENAYSSIESCLTYIRDGLERSRENTVYNEKANAVYVALAERATFLCLPDVALSLCVRQFLDRQLADFNALYVSNPSYYAYLFGAEAPSDALVAAYYGYSRDNYLAEMKQDCIPSVKAEFCYYYLLRHYGVTISDEEYAASYQKYLDLYGEGIFQNISTAEIRDQFLRDKVTSGLIAYFEENGLFRF